MPIPLRPDFNAAQVRATARQSKHAGQARRLPALAAVYEGATRTEAAKIGGVTLQIVRDWVIRLDGSNNLAESLVVRFASPAGVRRKRIIEPSRGLTRTVRPD
jgi:hypothetical protein